MGEHHAYVVNNVSGMLHIAPHEGGLLSLRTEMFQRVCRLVCNLQDLLVCRVCINYPGTLLINILSG